MSVIQTVVNRSTAAQAVVQPVLSDMTIANLGIERAGTADAVRSTGPAPASINPLGIGAGQTFQWAYTVSGEGSLRFCNSATNNTGSSTSARSCTDYVAVGNFTALLDASPVQIINAQSVTVVMTVTNNGSTPIANIVPTLTPPAGGTCVTGPTPPKINTLTAGASSTFQWMCTLTGLPGDSKTFTGYARDDDGDGLYSVPNPATSNPVLISMYVASVTPDTVSSGSAMRTFTFNVKNNGSLSVNQVKFTFDESGACPNSLGFVYSSRSGGCSTTWGSSTSGSPVTAVTFSTGSDYIPIGGSCDFSITFSCVPTVSLNTDYLFRTDIWDTANIKASLGSIVKVTVYSVALSASANSIGAGCYSVITATITPNPGAGQTVNWVESAGILLPSHTTPTDASGQAQITLKAPYPYDGLVTSGTITATFQDATGSAVINFNNIDPPCASAKKRIFNWREVIK